MALKVAEEGGLFDLRACQACAPRLCTSSTRSNGHLIAFVDPYTVVVLDRKSKKVLRTVRCPARGCSADCQVKAKPRAEVAAAAPAAVDHDRKPDPDETVVAEPTSVVDEKATPAFPASLPSPVARPTHSPITLKLPAWSQVAAGRIVINDSPTTESTVSPTTEPTVSPTTEWTNSPTATTKPGADATKIAEPTPMPTAKATAADNTHKHERAAWHAQHKNHLANEERWAAQQRQYEAAIAGYKNHFAQRAHHEAAWAAEKRQYEATIASLNHEVQQLKHEAQQNAYREPSSALQEREYESTIASLKQEARQHAHKEAAWTSERVQYAANEARRAHERDVHAAAVSSWDAERVQFAAKEARWVAERNHYITEWQKAMKHGQTDVAVWRVQQHAYEQHIALLEANAVKDRAAMLDRLADAERAVIGLRAAIGVPRGVVRFG